MTITSTTGDKILKEWYAPRAESMLFKDFPLLENIKKERAGGRFYVQAVLNGANVRRSHSYAFTQNSITEVSPAVQFQVPYLENYCTVAISSKLWRQSEADAGSFISAFKYSQDAGIAAMRKNLALELYRDGTGVIGQMANSATNVSTITLSNRADIFNFEVGDLLMASQTAGGAIDLVGSGYTGMEVVSLLDNGTTAYVVCKTTINLALTDINTTHYLYSNSGDALNTSTTPVAVQGLLAWSPASTASLTVSFNGVTRSSDQRRLAGQYVANPNSNPIDEQIQNGITQLVSMGGAPKGAYANPADVLLLQKVASGKVMRDQGGDAKFGFKSVMFATSKGDIRVFSDPACPQGYVFLLDTDGIKFVSLGEPIGVRKAGDSTMVRTASNAVDAWVIDWITIGNMVVERPGQCIATVAV